MGYDHQVYNAFHISDKIEVKYFSCLVYKSGLLIICHGKSVTLLKQETKYEIRPSLPTSKDGLKTINIHKKILKLHW